MQISMVENCLVYGPRTIIPASLQNSVLKALHLAHPGIVRMKAIAREHVYWPGINAEIEKLVRQCEDCQKAAKASPKVPLCPWPIPTDVFERIHIDFAGPCADGFTYLLVVDSYSKWPEIFKMANTSSKTTIKCLQTLVNRLGIPKFIISDNGPQFRSAEFADFCKSNGIEHTFSPPFHPQSNGQVERFVDTFKRAMQKCTQDGPDWADKMLLAYRTTPHSALNGHSPDQLFLGRKLRTKLTLLHPDGNPPKSEIDPNLQSSRQEYSNKMADNFNQNTKENSFVPGEAIFLLNYRFGKTHWLPGTILERIKNSPTYRVSVPSIGRNVHRRANQMRRRLPLDLENPPSSTKEKPTGTPMQSPPKAPKNVSVQSEQNVSSRPQRTRKPTQFLDVDPTNRTSYKSREFQI